MTLNESSSAVAKRPREWRDASCLSVVSFNSRPTKRRAEFFYCYVGYMKLETRSSAVTERPRDASCH